MKKISCFILICLLGSPCFAKSHILYNTETREIKSIDLDDCAQVGEGEEKVVSNEDYSLLTYPDSFYLFKNNMVKLNAAKLDRLSVEEEKQRKKTLRKAKIKAKMEKIAEQALIDNGELEAEVL